MTVKAGPPAVLILLLLFPSCGKKEAMPSSVAAPDIRLDPVCYEAEGEAEKASTLFHPGARPALPDGVPCLGKPLAARRLLVSRGFRDPRHFRPKTHTGTDLPAAPGTPVLAVAAGKVIFARASARDTNIVTVDIGGGWTVSSAHLSEIRVREGETVAAGQILGLSGGAVGAPGSGPCTTGPHLHLSAAFEGRYLDLEPFLCEPFAK